MSRERKTVPRLWFVCVGVSPKIRSFQVLYRLLFIALSDSVNYGILFYFYFFYSFSLFLQCFFFFILAKIILLLHSWVKVYKAKSTQNICNSIAYRKDVYYTGAMCNLRHALMKCGI